MSCSLEVVFAMNCKSKPEQEGDEVIYTIWRFSIYEKITAIVMEAN